MISHKARSLGRRTALGTGEGAGVPEGAGQPWGSLRAQGDEAELWGSALPGATFPNSRRPSQAPPLRRALQRSSDALSEARLFAKKPHLQSASGEKSPFKKNILKTLWGARLPVGLLQAGSSARAGLGRALQSRAEPSRAQPSVLSPLIHSLSPGAVVASRELQQRSFPHPLPPSVCLPWQKSSALVTNRCSHPSSSEALFIFLALMSW